MLLGQCKKMLEVVKVLAAAAGRSNNAIASELAIADTTVTLWRKRMATQGSSRREHLAAQRGGSVTIRTDGQLAPHFVEVTESDLASIAVLDSQVIGQGDRLARLLPGNLLPASARRHRAILRVR